MSISLYILVLDAKCRRPLVLISKILQNMSNGKQFKEDFMLPLNQFINDNVPVVKDFFDTLVSTLIMQAIIIVPSLILPFKTVSLAYI